MRIAGLFSGVGGLELGMTRAGHATALLCEIWDPAVAVLREHHPGMRVIRDVTKLKKLPNSIDLVVAGFPCQDLSQAGKTAGIGGERSNLVEHVFRLLDGCCAPLVLFENVPFMLRLEKGSAMSRLAKSLEQRGFRWAYRTINSRAFLPQRRERVFLLASRGELDPADVLFSDEAFPPDDAVQLGSHAHGFYWTEGVKGLGWAPDGVPPLKNGSTVGIPSPPAIVMPDGVIIKPDIRDAERLQGLEVDWTKPAEKVGRASLRWSLVGNAVTVPVAEWIGRRLLSPKPHRRGRDRLLLEGMAWPRAARSDGQNRYGVRISEYPVWCARKPLHEFLMFRGEPLSVRATRGFLGRTKMASLRFPQGFLRAVELHLSRMEALNEALGEAA